MEPVWSEFVAKHGGRVKFGQVNIDDQGATSKEADLDTKAFPRRDYISRRDKFRVETVFISGIRVET
jgi:hypothetical protein